MFRQAQHERDNKQYNSEWNADITFFANSSIADVLTKMDTSEKGLSQQQVKARLTQYGFNVLQKATKTWCDILKNQVVNPFILIFIVIGGIYFFTQQYTECIILLIIMVINTLIGFYQEYQSNRAMEFLKSYLQATIVVHRDGEDVAVETNTLVPGDLIRLKAGDVIPADCRFIATENCTVDEAMLTGESLPVKKMHELSDKKVTAVYDAYTVGYAGTIVVDGHATAVVFATGRYTEMGSIAQLATHTTVKSNLAKGTMQLAKIVFGLVLLSLVLVMVINIFFKQGQMSFLNFLLFAGALAITAIPTALPIVITFCLTQGAMALHKHKMIVKRLSAIEDLGGIEVFCSDKTGTLTENSLTVQDVYVEDEKDVLLYAALTASIITPAKKNVLSGFDLAIEKALTEKEKKELPAYHIVQELPFTYKRYRSIAIVQKESEQILIAKGPKEYIIPFCSLTEQENVALNSWVTAHETQGNRVLAIAIKNISHALQGDDIEREKSYDHVGLISFTDPLKKQLRMRLKKLKLLVCRLKY